MSHRPSNESHANSYGSSSMRDSNDRSLQSDAWPPSPLLSTMPSIATCLGRALAPSATATQTMTAAPAEESSQSRPTLHLRGGSGQRADRHIQWDEAVVDNEHMNKKSSKVCCIYHRDDEGDEENDCDGGAPSLLGPHPFPNAYERQPKPLPPKKDPSS